MAEPVERFAAEDLRGWIVAVLCAAGVRQSHAEAVARVLLAADVRGVDSHGIARLPAYVRLVQDGLIARDVDPVVVRDGGAAVVVDAGNIIGPAGAEYAMKVALDRARSHGVGWVAVTHSNHFGIAGYYAQMAIDEGMIGLCGTSAPALVAPTRSTKAFLGTNPIAFGAPTGSEPALLLDMATSAAAGGKFEIAIRQGESIPLGWGLDPDGRPTDDPGRVFGAGGALAPLGSFEELGSYKGYGLALMVEVLSAMLTLSPYGPGIGRLTSGPADRPAGTSHFLVALDPSRFAPVDDFTAAMDRICEDLRSLPTDEATGPVLIPGEREWQTARERSRDGVPLEPPVVASLQTLADHVGVPLVDRIDPARTA